jgi:hypothetical protein
LAGRSAREAAEDLLHLAVQQGPRGLISRLGYRVTRIGPPPPYVEPLTLTHAWGNAHNPLFDLTPTELAANRAVTEQFAARETDVRSATWFVSYFNHALFGGIHTILRLMSWSTEHYGVEHRLVVFDRMGVSDGDIRAAISDVFPNLVDVDIVLPVDGQVPYDELPPTDIAVATLWVSAFCLARFNRTKAKFYMVADFEPSFYEAGTVYALTEATYRLGFAGIVNTPALREIYEAYGSPSVHFVPSVEAAPPADKPSQRGAPVQIVLYGRPSTPRNAFELIVAACRQLKAHYGDAIRIISAGEDWDPAHFGVAGVIENRGLIGSIDEVHALYSESDIGLCFMLTKHPSYQPMEYLAHGVAPVCNVNAATTWLLRHEENCLITEPYPSNIAASVGRLIEDPELRQKLAEAGGVDVTSTTWDSQFHHVWSFVAGSQSTT